MPNAKTKNRGRIATRAKKRRSQAKLTTAFVMKVGTTLPKGMAGFTFRAPSKAAEVLAGKPAKVKALLQGYGEAFAKSREAGRAVSFRVKVDPSGGATVSPVEEAFTDRDAFPVEEIGEPSPELQRALE